ncbi:MAG: hypothetical protein WCF98_11355 [Synechococcus sp. ELA057]
MAEAPYRIALALVERGGTRALPLNGRSLRPGTDADVDPGELGRSLALELLLRLWQQSDVTPYRRAAGEGSLLLVDLPMELMHEQLPLLKAAWLGSGDSEGFRTGLSAIALRGWRIAVARHEPLHFVPWP